MWGGREGEQGPEVVHLRLITSSGTEGATASIFCLFHLRSIFEETCIHVFTSTLCYYVNIEGFAF